MLPHAREGHVKRFGKIRDRSVFTPELFQNTPSGGIRERSERGIKAGLDILNHLVQYLAHRLNARKARSSACGIGGRIG
jgi:hypothetical protein